MVVGCGVAICVGYGCRMDAGAGSLFKEGGLETTDWLAECVEYKGIDGVNHE
jgi:hypothetical protein